MMYIHSAVVYLTFSFSTGEIVIHINVIQWSQTKKRLCVRRTATKRIPHEEQLIISTSSRTQRMLCLLPRNQHTDSYFFVLLRIFQSFFLFFTALTNTFTELGCGMNERISFSSTNLNILFLSFLFICYQEIRCCTHRARTQVYLCTIYRLHRALHTFFSAVSTHTCPRSVTSSLSIGSYQFLPIL